MQMQKEEKNNENANLDKGLKSFKFKLKAAEKSQAYYDSCIFI